MVTVEKKHITGILLAGGRSSRMGTDKGFVMLKGLSFANRIINTMKPFVHEIIIVSDHTRYDKLMIRRVEDIVKDSGPVAGIHAALTHSHTDLNLVLSCDIPLIEEEVVSTLLQGYDPQYDIIQLAYNDSTIPLIGLYHKNCLPQCESLLKQGERRLTKFVEASKTKTIELPQHLGHYTTNVNTREQLELLKNEYEH